MKSEVFSEADRQSLLYLEICVKVNEVDDDADNDPDGENEGDSALL